MKKAAFIPIKVNSSRVLGKNMRILNDRPLYEWLFSSVAEADCFDEVFVDTNVITYPSKKGDKLLKKIEEYGFIHLERREGLDEDWANGNDLIVEWESRFGKEFGWYYQLFVTGPFLNSDTIKDCVSNTSPSFDSVFTYSEVGGFFWFNDNPLNYQPGILPRSQDLQSIVRETTALYGISRDSLLKYKCRIGRNPRKVKVDEFE